MQLTQLLQVLIVLLFQLTVKCELTEATLPSMFDYPSTVMMNSTNLNSRNGFVQVDFPWPIMMHGHVYYQTKVNSNSSRVFGINTIFIQTSHC
mgnify:FL=1